MSHAMPSTGKSTTGRTVVIRGAFRSLSRLAPGTASRLAERIFITPSRPRAPMREVGWAANAERSDIDCAGDRLPVWTWGEGSKTVLLVHGWGGRGLQLGACVEPLVGRGCRVVSFDNVGHGAALGRTSSLPEMATGLAEIASQTGPFDALVAHSLGATAAALALERGGLDVRRLVFLAPPARLGAIGRRFCEMSGFTPEVVDRMRHRLEHRFDFVWDEIEPCELARNRSASLLVVHDRDDREVPFSEGRDLAAAWPGARLVETLGLGHRRLLRDPHVLAQAADFAAGNC